MNLEERKLALASFKQHPVWEFLSGQLMEMHKDSCDACCSLDPAVDATLLARQQGHIETVTEVFTVLNTFAPSEETL